MLTQQESKAVSEDDLWRQVKDGVEQIQFPQRMPVSVARDEMYDYRFATFPLPTCSNTPKQSQQTFFEVWLFPIRPVLPTLVVNDLSLFHSYVHSSSFLRPRLTCQPHAVAPAKNMMIGQKRTSITRTLASLPPPTPTLSATSAPAPTSVAAATSVAAPTNVNSAVAPPSLKKRKFLDVLVWPILLTFTDDCALWCECRDSMQLIQDHVGHTFHSDKRNQTRNQQLYRIECLIWAYVKEAESLFESNQFLTKYKTLLAESNAVDPVSVLQEYFLRLQEEYRFLNAVRDRWRGRVQHFDSHFERQYTYSMPWPKVPNNLVVASGTGTNFRTAVWGLLYIEPELQMGYLYKSMFQSVTRHIASGKHASVAQLRIQMHRQEIEDDRTTTTSFFELHSQFERDFIPLYVQHYFGAPILDAFKGRLQLNNMCTRIQKCCSLSTLVKDVWPPFWKSLLQQADRMQRADPCYVLDMLTQVLLPWNDVSSETPAILPPPSKAAANVSSFTKSGLTAVMKTSNEDDTLLSGTTRKRKRLV